MAETTELPQETTGKLALKIQHKPTFDGKTNNSSSAQLKASSYSTELSGGVLQGKLFGANDRCGQDCQTLRTDKQEDSIRLKTIYLQSQQQNQLSL